jgi:hypothetical protein
MDELVDRLKNEKARKETLVQELQGLGDLDRIVSLDTKRLRWLCGRGSPTGGRS